MSIANKANTEKERIKNLLRANYHKTALGKNSGTSRPTKLFLKWLKNHPKIIISKILDFGAGKGRDEIICKHKFEKYFGYDPHRDFGYSQPEHILNGIYDLIICNYILNVIIPEDREIIIKTLFSHLQKGSLILIGVRQDKYEVKSNWKSFEDGFITTRLTFQHFFTISEIKDIFSPFSKIITLSSRGCYLLLPKKEN